MLYESLSQPLIFCLMCLGGFFAGIVFDFKSILFFLRKKAIFSHIYDFFATFLALFLCFFINLKFNFGEFRLFSIMSFFLAFIVERMLWNISLAKIFSKCYDKHKEKQNGKAKT